MHELSLCRSILNIINEHVADKNSKRITKISLTIGQLVAVDESALRFGFDMVSKNSVAAGAILEIITIEGQAICNACQKHGKLAHYYDACEHCGQYSLMITQGEELRVQSMEVE